ncbi:MAG: diguanylate cyclase [Burkholderiaceae bacterium]
MLPAGALTPYRLFILALAFFAMVVLAGTGVLLASSFAHRSDARQAMDQDRRVDQLLRDVLSDVLQAESSQRAYLISDQADYLGTYYVALEELQHSRGALVQALDDSPGASDELAKLDEALSAKLQNLGSTLQLKTSGHSDAATERLVSGSGNRETERLRATVQSLVAGQNERGKRQRALDVESIDNNYWLLGGSVLANILLSVVLAFRMRHASGRNDELNEMLASAAARQDQVERLSELGRFLQSSADMDEAVLLLKQRLPVLMGAPSGALYLQAVSKNGMQLAFHWDGEPYVDSFEPNDCWAIRLGQPFRQPAEAGAGGCAHLETHHARNTPNTTCLPMVVHGELTGLLVLSSGGAEGAVTPEEAEDDRRHVLEQVCLSLGNLKLRESLRQQSIRDVLTGLYNRRFLEEALQREVWRAARHGPGLPSQGLVLLMIDIDHFKDFNDRHGHEVGDLVLTEVARVMQRDSRGSDVAARYGGEEFTVVLVDMPVALAVARAEQMRADIEALPRLHLANGQAGTVTISIGLAVYPADGNSGEALLRSADKALYAAKHAGRNRVVIASAVSDDPPFPARRPLASVPPA